MALLGLAVVRVGYRAAPAAIVRLRATRFARPSSRTTPYKRCPPYEAHTPTPEGLLALVERAVRTFQLAAGEGTSTGVHAVEARPDRVTLYIDPHLERVVPFELTARADDHQVMVCEQPDRLPQGAPGSVMARYLATVGHSADGAIVLLNFEAAPHTALIGHPPDTQAVLRALAVDLAISSWGGSIVLAGFGAELPARLGDGRLTYVPALDQASPAGDGERLLLSANPLPHDGVPEGYSAAVFACPPGQAHRYPTAWHLILDGHTAHLDTLDLAFEPQRVSDEEYAALLAAIPPGVPTADPGNSGFASPQAEEGPTIRVLGIPELTGTCGELKEPSKKARLTELAAYLFFHPGRDHHAMDQAIWPDVRVSPSTRNSSICRLRAWLGNDAQGHPYLPTGAGYTYSPAMRSDWTAFSELAHAGLADPSPTGTEALAQALAHVRGQPFSGTDPRRYGWADCLRQEMIDAIAVAAHELATRHLAAGDLSGARAAALKGLLAEPGSELLLRDQILALAAGKNITAIKEIAERLTRRNSRLGVEAEPETSNLLDRYLGA